MCGLGCGVFGAVRGPGCVLVLVLMWTSWRGRPVVSAGSWASVPWGMAVGRPLRSGFPVFVSALGHPVAFGFRGTSQGALAVGGRRQWRCGACVGGPGSRVATVRGVPGWPGRTQACMLVCSWCGLFLGVAGGPPFWAGRLVLAGGAWLVVVRGLAGVGEMKQGVGCVCAECAVDCAGAL